jgi:hypothetical protein
LNTGTLVGIFRSHDNSTLSFSAGKAATDTVPQPCCIAFLMIPGAVGPLDYSRRLIV